MASMSAVASVAAVPTGLRSELRSSARSRGAASHVMAGATSSRRSVVVQASSSEQESQAWNVAKSAAAAAAVSLMLSASPVEAKEDNAFLSFPDNEAGEASQRILGDAKRKGDESFAEAQKTGMEITGQAASAGEAQPAISQVDPNAPEASDKIGDAIAARADVRRRVPCVFCHFVGCKRLRADGSFDEECGSEVWIVLTACGLCRPLRTWRPEPGSRTGRRG